MEPRDRARETENVVYNGSSRAPWTLWSRPVTDARRSVEERRAGLVLSITKLLLAASVLVVVLDSLIPDAYLGPLEEDATFRSILTLFPLLAGYVMTRRGWVDWGAAVVVTTVWLSVVLAIAIDPDVAPGFVLMFVGIPVILSGLLMPNWYTVAMTFLAATTVVYSLDGTGTYQFPTAIFLGFLLFTGLAVGIQRFREEDLERIEKQARDLEHSQRRTQTLLGGAFEAILLHEDGAAIDVNPAFTELFGWSVGPLRSLDLATFLETGDETDLEAALEAAHDGSVELVGRARTGERFPVEARARGLGERDRRVLILRDLTDRKRAEHEHARRAQEATRREEMEKLAWTTSHALRTPIRTVKSFAQLLQRDLGPDLDERVAEELSLLVEGAEDLDRITQDLRYYAETVQRPIQPSNVDLEDVLDDVVRSLAIGDGDTARLEIGDLERVHADPTLLRRALFELLHNAVTHGAPDEPVRASVHARRLPQDKVEIVVEDDGPGIPERFHERVFGMFERLRPGAERAGSGLGLPIVRRIVDVHGGRIGIESPTTGDRLKGTRVRLTLPACEELADARGPVGAQAGSTRHQPS